MVKRTRVVAVVLALLCAMTACATESGSGVHDPGELTTSDMGFMEEQAVKLVAARSGDLANLDNNIARDYNRGKPEDEKIKADYVADDYEYFDFYFEPTGYFFGRSEKNEKFIFIFKVRVRVDSKDTNAIIYGMLEVNNLKRNNEGLYADEVLLKHYSLTPPSGTKINNIPLTWESIIRALYGSDVKPFKLPSMS